MLLYFESTGSTLLAGCTQSHCLNPAYLAEGSGVLGSEQGSVPAMQQQHSCFVTCSIFSFVGVRAGEDPL